MTPAETNRAKLASYDDLAEAEGAYRAMLRKTPGRWVEARGDLDGLRQLGKLIAATALETHRTLRGPHSLLATVARLTESIDDRFGSPEAFAVVQAAALEAVGLAAQSVRAA